MRRCLGAGTGLVSGWVSHCVACNMTSLFPTSGVAEFMAQLHADFCALPDEESVEVLVMSETEWEAWK